MAERSNQNQAPNNQNPNAPVGITNRDKVVEEENDRRQQQHGAAQMSGDAPIGTHEGITRDELTEPAVQSVDAGYEAERGADIADDKLP